MARDFTKNTSNTLALGTAALGTLVNGASAISFAAWAYADSYSATSTANNRVFTALIGGITNAGFAIGVDNTGANPVLRVSARSDNADALQAASSATIISTGQWWHLGGVVNFAADTITPYVNGASEGDTGVTFANTTYVSGSPSREDVIGAISFITSIPEGQWDGRIAEFALWNVNIGANAFRSLAQGHSPLRVHPTQPVTYMPLWGDHSPEIDLRDALVGTIAGSVPKGNHAPVVPFGSWLWGSVPFAEEAATLFRRNLFLRTGSRGAMGGV